MQIRARHTRFICITYLIYVIVCVRIFRAPMCQYLVRPPFLQHDVQFPKIQILEIRPTGEKYTPLLEVIQSAYAHGIFFQLLNVF